MMQLKNRKSLVAVFAHPDDEAMGPAGTLHKYTKTHDVYLICATKGEVGQKSPPKYSAKELGEIRTKELKKAAKIIGAKDVFFLGFIDGELSNSLYQDLAAKIEQKLNLIKPEIIMTFEPKGISGHLDHIAVSLATTFVFYRLPFIKTLLCYCAPIELTRRVKDYFVYFPPGYRRSEVDKIVDVADVWDVKLKAMKAHVSQRYVADDILKRREGLPKKEYFTVLQKK